MVATILGLDSWQMSETVSLWVFGVQSSVIISLITVLWRIQQARLKEMQSKLDALYQRTDFAAFQARDKAREEGWTTWREDRVERALDNHEERLRLHTAGIARIEGRLNGAK